MQNKKKTYVVTLNLKVKAYNTKEAFQNLKDIIESGSAINSDGKLVGLRMTDIETSPIEEYKEKKK